MADKIITLFGELPTYVNIAIGIGIFALCTALRNPVSSGILTLVAKIIFARKPEKRKRFKSSLKKPLSFFIMLTGAILGVYINIPKPIVLNTYKVFSILIVAWCVINYFSDSLNDAFEKDNNNKINGIAVKFISNILKFLVICIAVVMVISELGYNINGLLTGLGVGGLAVSLAAQDSLKNLVSGFFIMLDRPFDVGDLIETGEFKGVIEDITMRSTRIRTLDDTVVIVPNSKIGEAAITNLSKLTKRLIEFKIGLVYSADEATLKKCEKEIADYLIGNEKVCPESVRVRFCEFDNFSQNIQIRCYINTYDYEEYCKFNEELNFEIKRIVEENNTDFAFPTTTVQIEKEQKL